MGDTPPSQDILGYWLSESVQDGYEDYRDDQDRYCYSYNHLDEVA